MINFKQAPRTQRVQNSKVEFAACRQTLHSILCQPRIGERKFRNLLLQLFAYLLKFCAIACIRSSICFNCAVMFKELRFLHFKHIRKLLKGITNFPIRVYSPYLFHLDANRTAKPQHRTKMNHYIRLQKRRFNTFLIHEQARIYTVLSTIIADVFANHRRIILLTEGIDCVCQSLRPPHIGADINQNFLSVQRRHFIIYKISANTLYLRQFPNRKIRAVGRDKVDMHRAATMTTQLQQCVIDGHLCRPFVLRRMYNVNLDTFLGNVIHRIGSIQNLRHHLPYTAWMLRRGHGQNRKVAIKCFGKSRNIISGCRCTCAGKTDGFSTFSCQTTSHICCRTLIHG